jgi:hypothetical protein
LTIRGIAASDLLQSILNLGKAPLYFCMFFGVHQHYLLTGKFFGTWINITLSGKDEDACLLMIISY